MNKSEIKRKLTEGADKLAKGALSQEEKMELYDLAFQFLEEKKGLHAKRFFYMLMLCREYINEFGYAPTHGVFYKNEYIGRWYNKHKKDYENGTMPETRRKMFEDIGVSFEDKVKKQEVVRQKEQEKLDSFIKSVMTEDGKETAKKEYLNSLISGDLPSLERAEACQRLAFLLKEKAGVQFTHFVEKAILCQEYFTENTLPPKQSIEYGGIMLGSWYGTQKHAYLNNNLSEGKKWILDELGIPFEPIYKREKNPEIDYRGLPASKKSENWLGKLSLYISFKEEFKREPFRREMYGTFAVGSWCDTQKKRYANRALSPEEEEKLREAGMPLEKRKQTPEFDEMLLLYCKYKELTGHGPSIKEVVCGVKLGEWLAMQDFLYSRRELPEEKHRKLTDAGFVFSMDEKPILNWRQMLYLYERFKKEAKTEPSTTEIYCCAQLGKWVTEQRAHAAELSEEQKEKLIMAGFSFDPKEEQWMDKFKLLKDFLEEFGTFPKARTIYKNVELGSWLWITQKNAFFDNTMPNYRKDMLADIGFSFDYAIDFNKFWVTRYKEFADFADKHGRLPLFRKESGEYRDEAAIGRWYQKQLTARGAGYLSKKQDKLIQEVENKYLIAKEEFSYDRPGER